MSTSLWSGVCLGPSISVLSPPPGWPCPPLFLSYSSNPCLLSQRTSLSLISRTLLPHRCQVYSPGHKLVDVFVLSALTPSHPSSTLALCTHCGLSEASVWWGNKRKHACQQRTLHCLEATPSGHMIPASHCWVVPAHSTLCQVMGSQPWSLSLFSNSVQMSSLWIPLHTSYNSCLVPSLTALSKIINMYVFIVTSVWEPWLYLFLKIIFEHLSFLLSLLAFAQ